MQNRLVTLKQPAADFLTGLTPFFESSDNIGHSFYFRTLVDAETFQAAHGGYVLETTPRRIWRVTLADLD